jgi:putative salt-induced outer membrane protein YdiY
MSRKVRAAAIAMAVLTLAAGRVRDAQADVIQMKNGDRITGRVKNRTEGKLVIGTPYAGDIRVDISEVASVEFDAPVPVFIEQQGVREVSRLEAEPDLAEGAREDVESLGRVLHVKPTPGQAGTGIDYSGNAKLSATYTRGNARSDLLYGDAELRGRSVQRRFAVAGQTTRGMTGDLETANNWQLRGNHDWLVDAKTFFYARGTAERDPFRDLRSRLTAGGGIGRTIVEDADGTFTVQGGIDYVTVDRFAGPNEGYPAVGWGLRYRQWFLDRRMQAFHEQDGFGGLGAGASTLVRTRTGLRVPVKNGLNLSAQVNLDWDSDPAPGRTSTDTIYLLGLGYAW